MGYWGIGNYSTPSYKHTKTLPTRWSISKDCHTLLRIRVVLLHTEGAAERLKERSARNGL